MNDNHGIIIREAYKDYEPPFDVVTIVVRIPGHIGHLIRDYIGHPIRSESATQSGIISATFWADPE